MGKKIDLGESPEPYAGATTTKKTKKPPKYYPRVDLPHAEGALDPSMVGRTVTVQVEARIAGVRQNHRDGQQPRTVYDLELRSMTTPRPVRPGGKGGGRGQGNRAAYSDDRRRNSRAGG
jgi:hypothetical protein